MINLRRIILIGISLFQLDRKGNLWSLANKYQMLLTNGMDVTEDNFGLFRMKPREIIKGTVCENKRRDRAVKDLAVVVDDSDTRFDGDSTKKEEASDKKVEVKVEMKVEEQKKVVE